MTERSWTGSDPASELLVEESRARQVRPLEGRERVGRWMAAASFLAVAVSLPLAAGTQHVTAPLLALSLVVLYAAASRIEFEVGSGSAVPTQVVFIPMLFLLPAWIVPLAVAIGYIGGQLPDYLRGRLHPERVAVVLGSSWFSIGPALVMLAAHEPDPTPRRWPLVLALLAAQFGADFLSTTVREWAAVGVRPSALYGPLAWVFMVDALLAPIGFALAVSAGTWGGSVAFALPLLALLAIFARERTTRIDQMLELSTAYRGTAFLLGDVVEADDAYTGSHSRDVVKLVLEVAERVGLDPSLRRKAEFVALLHDVGKIRIPNEIINKPGPLTPEERAIINTHTIEGERLLERVGGLLAEVGRVVRSCHERYDGAGYPDGLDGDRIPLIARIVCCCDAFNAMTTARPYRRALSLAEALAELRGNSGTQFDPHIVAELVELVGNDEPLLRLVPPVAVPARAQRAFAP